jgi:hypothetical protein
MNENANDNPSESMRIPASLQQRKAKEPVRMVTFKIPHSWWEELSALAREYDQDVSIFLREATEDWLQRARQARKANPPVEPLGNRPVDL